MEKDLTFVYICRPGDNEELRYSIRSVAKNFPNSTIWVIGDAPRWYIGNYIKNEQSKDAYSNAYLNLRVAATSSQLPENIVIMNDDFYILDGIDDISVFHEGTLEDKANKYFDHHNNTSYTRKIIRTDHKLKKLGFNQALSYELHVPLPVEKNKLIKVLDSNNYLWRSLYGNMFNLGGTFMEDVKVYNAKNMSFKNYDYKNLKYPFLSSQDDSFKKIHNDILVKMFPKPSKYET